MCIAILNTKKAGLLPKEQIKNSWDNNDMGGGLLWNKNGALGMFKTYKYNEFIKKYNSLRADDSVDNIVLHFRIATSGINGKHNLHPFIVNKDLGFVHNGVIKGLGNTEYSDTYQFNDMLRGFKHNFLNCDTTKLFIADYIGSSKLLFLDSSGKYTIINERYGHWNDDNWYSNDSYKSYNDYVYYGNKKVSKSKQTYNYDYWYDEPIKEEVSNDWQIYEYLCGIYGLDPMDDNSYDFLDYYIDINNAEDMYDLYDIVTGNFIKS